MAMQDVLHPHLDKVTTVVTPSEGKNQQVIQIACSKFTTRGCRSDFAKVRRNSIDTFGRWNAHFLLANT